MLRDLFGDKNETLRYGTVAAVIEPGRYTVTDNLARRYTVRSDLALKAGERVVFKGDWILARAARERAPKIYNV